MINVDIEFTVEKATVDDKEVSDRNAIPFDEMEKWLELFYSNEKYEGEDVDVNVKINNDQ